MKTVINFILVAVLSLGAWSLRADERGGHLDLTECASELRAYFGEEAEFHLVDQRRSLHGIKVRMAAKLDTGNTRFATCWLPQSDATGAANGTARPMLVVSAPINFSR